MRQSLQGGGRRVAAGGVAIPPLQRSQALVEVLGAPGLRANVDVVKRVAGATLAVLGGGGAAAAAAAGGRGVGAGRSEVKLADALVCWQQCCAPHGSASSASRSRSRRIRHSPAHPRAVTVPNVVGEVNLRAVQQGSGPQRVHRGIAPPAATSQAARRAVIDQPSTTCVPSRMVPPAQHRSCSTAGDQCITHRS